MRPTINIRRCARVRVRVPVRAFVFGGRRVSASPAEQPGLPVRDKEGGEGRVSPSRCKRRLALNLPCCMLIVGTTQR